MKKARSIFALCAAFACGLSLFACNKGPETGSAISVVMPEGAPAFAMAKLMADESDIGGRDAAYSVVDAAVLPAQLAQGGPDVALLPVNAAVKVAGAGTRYRMVSVNTHGNIYILGAGKDVSLAEMVGKKVGVMQLDNVPGLTLRAVLEEAGLPYTTDATLQGAADASLVNLVALTTAPAVPFKQGQIDYVVVPEPAATQVKAAAAEKDPHELALHDAYKTAFGTEQSYPQAVLLVKNELAQKAFVDDLFALLETNGAWVKANAETALEVCKDHFAPADMAAKFTVLNAAIYDKLNIRTVPAAQAKDNVLTYMRAINALYADDPTLGYGEPADAFFYTEA